MDAEGGVGDGAAIGAGVGAELQLGEGVLFAEEAGNAGFVLEEVAVELLEDGVEVSGVGLLCGLADLGGGGGGGEYEARGGECGEECRNAEMGAVSVDLHECAGNCNRR